MKRRPPVSQRTDTLFPYTTLVRSQVGEHRRHRRHLPLAAVNQHQIGPFALRPFGIFLQRACEAALEHLAHHREIVAGLRLGALDVELAIGALDPALRPRDDHRSEVRRLGKGCVSTCSSRWSPYHSKKNYTKTTNSSNTDKL